jgi:hypothetical protein
MTGINAILNGKVSRLLSNHLYLILLIPLVFIAYSLLIVPGIPIGNGDLPYIETSLYGLKKIWTWTEYSSNHNMEYLPRYPIIGLWLVPQALHISEDLAGKALIITGFFIASFSFYFSSLKFFRTKLDTDCLSFKIATVLGALFYAYNVWSFHRIGHWYFWIGYGFLPIFFVSVIYSLRNPKKLQYMVASVLLWSVASSTPHMVVFYGLIFMTLSIIFVIRYLRANQKSAIQLLRPIILIISIFILVNMYWIYPYIGSFGSDTFLWRTVVTEESTRDLSSDSYPLNVLRLLESTYNMGTINVVPSNVSTLYPFWIFASFVIPVFVFSSLFGKKRLLKYALFFSILSILGLLLVTGNFLPFNLNTTLLFYTPIISSLQMLFREPDKWAFLVAFGYSFLIVIASLNSSNRLKNMKYGKPYSISLALFIFACIVIYFYPAYKDSMENLYHPVILPKELGQLDNLKPAIKDKVFVMPTIPPYEVYDTTWGKDKRTEALHPYASPVPNIAPSDYNNVEKYNRLLVNLITTNKTDKIADFIYPLGASYMLYHNDTLAPYNNKLLDSISTLSDVKKLEDIGIFKIFKIGDTKKVEQVGIPEHNTLIIGGLDILGSLNNLHSSNLFSTSLFYLDQFPKDSNSYALVFNSEYVFLDRSENDFILSFVDNKYVIEPFDATNHHDPPVFWSKTATNDPGNAHFTPVLDSLGISNWDFDYGKGLVMTTAVGTNLSIPVTLQDDGAQSAKSDKLSLYMRYLENQKGGLIKIYFDGKLVSQVNTFDSISNNFVWNKIALLDLTSDMIEEKHTLTIENVNGFNAVNVFALVPQNEMNRLIKQTDSLLGDKTRAIYLLEAESNFYNEGMTTGFQNLFAIGNNQSNNNTLNNTVPGKPVTDNSTTVLSNTFKGQFTVPQNTDAATLQFLATQNPTTNANSTYLIKNLQVISASRNIPVLKDDFDRRNVTVITPIIPLSSISTSAVLNKSAPIGGITESIWENYQPDILSTSHEAKTYANPTKGNNTMGNNTMGNNTMGNNTIDNSATGDKSLKVNIKQGNFSYWGIISTDFIPANDNINYNVSLDISAENVIQLHSKVFYFDSNKKEIKWDFIFGGQDGSFEQKYDKSLLSPPGTKYMRLQVWVSPNSETYSSYSLDNVRMVEILKSDPDISFRGQSTSLENHNSTWQQIIDPNNFKDNINNNEILNERRNMSNINVVQVKDNANKTYNIQTKPFLVRANTIYNYSTTIDSENINSLLANVSFKNNRNVIESSKYGSNASNGNVLSMDNGSDLSTKLDIIKTSNYTIAVRVKTCETCTFLRVSINPESESLGNVINNSSINSTNYQPFPTSYVSLKDNASSSSKSSPLKWLYSNNTYHLKRGTYELKIHSDSKTDLDSVILYSVDQISQNSSSPHSRISDKNDNGSLAEVFSPQASTPAQIVDYKKINPTKYVLNIKNATRPYTISFAESYDPLWIAYSDNSNTQNDDNHESFKTSSIPLYSIVNGFFINKTGDYSLTIEYKAQGWFIQGAIVSLITVIIVMILLIFGNVITPKYLKKSRKTSHSSKT